MNYTSLIMNTAKESIIKVRGKNSMETIKSTFAI
jgi:hypothetical protein